MFKYGRIRKNPTTTRVGRMSRDVGDGALSPSEIRDPAEATLTWSIRSLRQWPGILRRKGEFYALTNCGRISGRTLCPQAQTRANLNPVVHKISKECGVGHGAVEVIGFASKSFITALPYNPKVLRSDA